MHRLLLFAAMAALAPASATADRRVYTLNLADSIEILSTIARGQTVWLGSLDHRGRTAIGWGRSLPLPFIPDAAIATLTPLVTVFAKPGQPPGLDLSARQEWFIPQRGFMPGRYSTSFEFQGGVILQARHPTIVRLVQSFTTFDRAARGRRPLTQGVRLIWEFIPSSPAAMQDAERLGAGKRKVMPPSTYGQTVFGSWRIGQGSLLVSLGLARKLVAAPSPLPNDHPTSVQEMLQRRAGKQTYRTLGLWRVEYTIQR